MKNLNTKFTVCANAQKKDLVENKKKGKQTNNNALSIKKIDNIALLLLK